MDNTPGKPGTIQAAIQNLRDRDLHHLASELEYKKLIIEEDPDDLPINPGSAQGFAAFAALETLPGHPNVTVSAQGHVGLAWVIPDPSEEGPGEQKAAGPGDDDHAWGKGSGVLGIWFLPDGMVRVCGTSGPVGQGMVRKQVNSTVEPSRVMSEIEPFMSRLRQNA